MARTVSIMAIAVGVLLFFMGPLGLNLTWIQALLFAMGVMVCFVPEGLPATLSVALAVGVQRMAKAQRPHQASSPASRRSAARTSSAPTRPAR